MADGKQYWIGPAHLGLIVTVKGNDDDFRLIVKDSMISAQVIKRLQKRTVLRETFEQGAAKCLVSAKDPSAALETFLNGLR